MSNNTLLTIITPVLNGERWIVNCILSVQMLSIPYEHIIVDGGSTDNTVSLVTATSRSVKIIYESRPGSGMYSAIHDGLILSKGIFCMYLNCDDVICPANLSNLFSDLRVLDADLIFGSGYIFDVDMPVKSAIVNSAMLPRLFLIKGVLPTIQPSIIFKRYLYSIEKFNPDLKLVGDLDLFMRLSLIPGIRILTTSIILAVFNKHSLSLGSINSSAAAVELSKVTARLNIADRLVLAFIRFITRIFF